ncbi:MAG: short-chain dehydrogenase/reductase [Bryobacterales bacterium]|nr:short-chain dehydrogenase/reductase [Bryobacterales bacterium]
MVHIADCPVPKGTGTVRRGPLSASCRSMNRKTAIVLAAATAGIGLTLRDRFARSRESELKGQVVLITGGSKGLGIALARRFAKEGCRLALCARNADELHRARLDLESTGADILTIVCDVTDQNSVRQMIAAAQRHFGNIDILVNNAGQIVVGPIASMTVEDFESAMKVMFWGVVYPTLALLPSFLERKKGRIVNITSFGGKVSVPHLVPYTCAKFAATGFSEGLRAELLGKGIKVTTIAPGLMRTGSFVNALFKGDREAEARWFSLAASMPLLTVDADKAAQEILTATKRGEAERILTSPAKLMSGLHGIAPGITADLLGIVAGLLLPERSPRNKAKAGSRLAFIKKPAMRGLLTLGLLARKRYLQRSSRLAGVRN